jgi:hypothetical protein
LLLGGPYTWVEIFWTYTLYGPESLEESEARLRKRTSKGKEVEKKKRDGARSEIMNGPFIFFTAKSCSQQWKS